MSSNARFRHLAWLLWLTPLFMPDAAAGDLQLRFLDRSTGHPVEGVIAMLDNGIQVLPQAREMAQRNRQFVPHTLTVPVASEIRFPNQDSTQHHV